MEPARLAGIAAVALATIGLVVNFIALPMILRQVSGLQTGIQLGMGEFKVISDQAWSEMMLVRSWKSGRLLRRQAESQNAIPERHSGVSINEPIRECPSGKPGNPGVPAEDGRPGIDGKDGPPGKDVVLTGEEHCIICPRGPTGPYGNDGNRGTQGTKGIKGEGGIPGVDGLEGAVGNPGLQGNPGTTGKPGFRGFPGKPGAGGKGKPGPKGLHGPIGRAGDQGPRGKGSLNPGPPGSAGKKGTSGLDGIPGRPGQRGDNGLIGMHGANVNYCPCPKELHYVNRRIPNGPPVTQYESRYQQPFYQQSTNQYTGDRQHRNDIKPQSTPVQIASSVDSKARVIQIPDQIIPQPEPKPVPEPRNVPKIHDSDKIIVFNEKLNTTVTSEPKIIVFEEKNDESTAKNNTKPKNVEPFILPNLPTRPVPERYIANPLPVQVPKLNPLVIAPKAVQRPVNTTSKAQPKPQDPQNRETNSQLRRGHPQSQQSRLPPPHGQQNQNSNRQQGPRQQPVRPLPRPINPQQPTSKPQPGLGYSQNALLQLLLQRSRDLQNIDLRVGHPRNPASTLQPRPGHQQNPNSKPQSRTDQPQNSNSPLQPRPGHQQNPESKPESRVDQSQKPDAKPLPRPANPDPRLGQSQNPENKPQLRPGHPQNPDPRLGQSQNPENKPQLRPGHPQNPDPRLGQSQNPENKPQLRPGHPQNPDPRLGQSQNPENKPQQRPGLPQNPPQSRPGQSQNALPRLRSNDTTLNNNKIPQPTNHVSPPQSGPITTEPGNRTNDSNQRVGQSDHERQDPQRQPARVTTPPDVPYGTVIRRKPRVRYIRRKTYVEQLLAANNAANMNSSVNSENKQQLNIHRFGAPPSNSHLPFQRTLVPPAHLNQGVAAPGQNPPTAQRPSRPPQNVQGGTQPVGQNEQVRPGNLNQPNQNVRFEQRNNVQGPRRVLVYRPQVIGVAPAVQRFPQPTSFYGFRDKTPRVNLPLPQANPVGPPGVIPNQPNPPGERQTQNSQRVVNSNSNTEQRLGIW